MRRQRARDKVRHTETVWIMMVKLVWMRTKIPHGREYIFSGSLVLSSKMYMWRVNGMYSKQSKRSATAIPVRRRLIWLVLISLYVSTMIFSMLVDEPRQQTMMERNP